MRQRQTDFMVPVLHEHTHAPRSILEQARKSGPDVTEMGAIKHTMELIAHSSCITNGAPAKVAREGRPGKTALLNRQSMGTKSELHKSPELTDASLAGHSRAQIADYYACQTSGDMCKALPPWKGQSRVTHGDFDRPAHGALLTCSWNQGCAEPQSQRKQKESPYPGP